jgi:hypothetical protein
MTEKKDVSSPVADLHRNSNGNGKTAWYRRKAVRIGAGLAASIVLLAIVLLRAYWPFSKERVTQSIEEEFAGKVTIGHFRTTAFPHPGSVAEDVEFRWATKSPDKTPLATVKKLTIQANYWDFLLRPGYVSRVVLEGLKIQVPPVGSGTRPMDVPATKTKTRLGEVIINDAVVEIARRDAGPLKFEIHSLRLKNVQDGKPFSYEAALRNPLPPGEIRIHGNFGSWNSTDPGQTAVTGKYSFADADLSVFHGIAGTLSSDGDFEGPLGQMQVKGKMTIPDFEVARTKHPVPVNCEYDAIVNGMNGDVTLQRVDGTVLKTKFLTKGTIAGRQGAQGKFASLDLAVNKGRIQDVLRVFSRAPKPPLNGVTNFRAHVTIPPGKAPFLKKVVMVADFGVDDAQFTKSETQESVAALSVRGAGKKPEESEEDPDNLISELSGHVELREGTATFVDFRFAVPDANATMHGTYDVIDEKVDLHGTLRTTAKFSEMTSGIKSVLLKPFDAIFKRKHGGGKIPVQLTGTYSDPHPGLELIR